MNSASLAVAHLSAHGQMCPQCEGLWLPRSSLGALAQMPEEALARSAFAATLEADHPEVGLGDPLHCPECAQPLLRFIYASDSVVTADLCRTHGLWLDDGELGSILEYLKRNEAF